MKKHPVLTITFIILLGSSVLLSGCTGNGSSGSTPGAAGSAPTFNVKGSSQLIALSNTVAATKPASSKFLASVFGSPEPLRYTIVNQGLSANEIKAKLSGKASSGSLNAVTPLLKGTNLLSVDASGNAVLAVKADFMVKVMYSVTDPKGEYVYLALDTGFVNPDGNDYSQFIAANNCAFYRVSLSDNSYSCVKEGVYIQPIDDTYNKTVSASVKPVQFDAKGFVYFPASPFTAKCTEEGACALYVSNWTPRIYRYDPLTKNVLALTQDNQKISYYLALNSGQIAYQSVDQFGTSLNIWQPDTSGGTNPNGVTINLTGSTNWISFFAADTYNTIIYGGAGDPQRNVPGKPGIRFAKPGASGALKAVLDTSLFNQGYSQSPAPAKVIVGDDGKLYGVFGPNQEQRQEPAPGGGTQWVYYTIYRLYQVLPALSVAKVEIKVRWEKDINGNWQPPLFQPINIYGGTPFQVANGYFFYKETKELIGYGLYDVIQMVDLNTRNETTLLDGGVNGTTLYQIYSWRVRGNKLYFSALDLGATQVVSGKIDTSLVAIGALQSTYLSTQRVASALGATSRVQDVEGTASIVSTGSTAQPYIKRFYATADNRYSLGIEFSGLMNEAVTEKTLSLNGAVEGPIAAMMVWIQNDLHLIPDLDNNGTGLPNDALLDLQQSTPLNYDSSYTLTVGTQASNRTGGLLALVDGTGAPAPNSKVLRTQPYGGWYIAENTAKFAGPYTVYPPSGSADKYGPYDMNVYVYSAGAGTVIKNLPPDYRVEFDAKNSSYTRIGVILFDKSPSFTNPPYYGSYEYQRNVTEMFIQSGGVWGYYARCDLYSGPSATATCTNGGPNSGYPTYWYSSGSYNEIMNGNWARYRIDTFGSNYQVSYSVDDGQSWTKVQHASPDTYYPLMVDHLVRRRPDNGQPNYELYLFASDGGLSIDNLAVWQLDSVGNVAGATPILSESFVGRTEGTPGLSDAPALDGSVRNTPNLKNMTPWRNNSSPAYPYNYLLY